MIAAGCASSPSSRPGTGSSKPSADLQGRSTGVLIQNAANGAVRVTLLTGGTNSFGATTYTPSNGTDRAPAQPVNVPLSSAEPLFLVDGVPYNPGPGGLLVGINADDIESIKAVKDPAELALYGMKGGNGVISIKMKQRPMD
jgi:TonB-dependent SusC/RagA subfamily outer membrane receptor